MLENTFSTSCFFNYCVGSPEQYKYLTRIYSFFIILTFVCLLLSFIKIVSIEKIIKFLSLTFNVLLLLFIIGQTFFNILRFKKDFSQHTPWTPASSQYTQKYGDIYAFAKVAQTMVPRGCSALYSSDFNLVTPYGYSVKFFLGYFLYPIDIRLNDPKHSPSCFVAFAKKNPEQSIPLGYHIILKDGNRSLLAIKNE
jgi:hypothetical protein